MEDKEKEPEKTEKEKVLALQEARDQRAVAREMLQHSPSVFLNVVKFEHCQRVAQMLSGSTMLPPHFRGNLGNCMIALNLAERFNADVFMLMQTMYVVHGKPGLEGKMVAALINSTGRYSDELKYEVEDTGQKTKMNVPRPDRVRAYATSSKSGETVHGPWISWEMAEAERWTDDKGSGETRQISKWQTMPEMMFKYRAASYFANVNCPEVKLGMMTTEEISDTVVDLQPQRDGSFSTEAPFSQHLKSAAGTSTDIYGGGKGEAPVDPREDGEDISSTHGDPKGQSLEEAYQEKIVKAAAAMNITEEQVQEYVNMACKQFEMTPDEFIESAVSDPDNFLIGLLAWHNENYHPQEEITGQDLPDLNALRKEFWYKKGKGFVDWVTENLERIPTFPDEIQKDIKAKWNKMNPGKPYPPEIKKEPKENGSQGSQTNIGDAIDDEKWKKDVERFKEILGDPAFYRVLARRNYKYAVDVPKQGRKAVLDDLKAEVDSKNA